jgi:hypothetical protein
MPRVAILIVAYNAKAYLSDLFQSLLQTNYPKESLALFIVDNASTDGTIEYIDSLRVEPSRSTKGFSSEGSTLITEIFSQITVIKNRENLGFAKGNNIAAEAAEYFRPDYLALLNQDTIVDPNWIQELVETAERDSKIGVVQSRLMLWPDTNRINSIGNEIHFLGFGFCRGYRDKLPTPNSELRTEIPYASGAAMLVRNDLYKQIGLFDPDYFMYHEDMDFCWRARLMGFKIVLAPASVVFHKYSFSKSIKKYYFMERNRFLTIFKNYRLATLLLLAPWLTIMEVGLFFQSLATGWWREKLRVYGFFFKSSTWRMIRQKRKESQLLRKQKDRDIVRLFTGRIEYQEISSPLLRYIANPFFSFVWAITRRIIWW